MLTADHLIALMDAYQQAHQISDARLSMLLFNDSKRVGMLRNKGGDIGSRSLLKVVRWLSENWPDRAVWPDRIERPSVSEVAA